MKKVSRIIAMSLIFTMLMSMAVMAASPSTSNTPTTSSQNAETPAPAYSESVQAQLAAPATTFSEGITAAVAGGTSVTVISVPVSAVNYALLGAKLLVGETATVLKAVTLALDPNATTTVVSLEIPGIVKGQKIEVLAFDPITKTWIKLKGVKVKKGKITFDMGTYNTFSIVSDTVAP